MDCNNTKELTVAQRSVVRRCKIKPGIVDIMPADYLRVTDLRDEVTYSHVQPNSMSFLATVFVHLNLGRDPKS